MVKYIFPSCALFALLLIPACTTHKVSSASWKPSKFAEFTPYAPQKTVDIPLLADMTTAVLLNDPQFRGLPQAKPIIATDLAVHPEFGPFLFESGNKLVVVADTITRVSELAGKVQQTEVLFVKIRKTSEEGQVSLFNSIEKIPLEAKPVQVQRTENGKIRLTPENMAAALANFSQWEGVHLNEEKGDLIFVGSNDASRTPQISAGDLITAYRAIFQHEALGEPLFVDMDFNYKKEDYLVTFGGGFEDTNPGRVLYEADLLLKGLSSGIDPWSNEKPLVDLMCADNKPSPIQKMYCKYLGQYWDKNRKNRDADKEIDELIDAYYDKTFTASLLTRMASHDDEPGAWEYMISADESKMRSILNEVEQDGYFSTNGGCACVTKDFVNQLTDCKTQCNKVSTLERVREIADLTPGQKSIVKTAKELYPLPFLPTDELSVGIEWLRKLMLKSEPTFQLPHDSNRENRRYFTQLSYFSPKIYAYLRNCSASNRQHIFKLLRKLDGRYGEGSERSLRAEIALLLFMSKEKGFIQDFANLKSERDQMLVAFIASTVLDPKYARMLDKLQFHQPLCSDYKPGGGISDIRDFNSAFSIFVCEYLNKYQRPYLADAIRGEYRGYQSAAEIGSQKKRHVDVDSMLTVRYWFYPGNEVLTLADSTKLNTFLFHRPNMQAKAERIETRRGPWEAPDLSLDLPGIQENLNLINGRYEELSEVFPVMKELSNLVRMLAFFRWIRYYQSEKFDLSAFSTATDFGTPTPRTYPVYETVVALPGGTLMRAVGGVDLHSATQVGFDFEKINGFVATMKRTEQGKDVNFDDKNYILAPAIVSSTSLLHTPGNVKKLTMGDQSIAITSKGASTSVSFTLSGQLKWSWAQIHDVLNGRQVGVFNNFSNGKLERSVQQGDQMQRLEVQQEETFVLAASAEKDKKKISLWEQLKANLTELGEANAPAEALWALFSIPFDHAQFTEKNSENLFIFRIDSNENQHWLGKRDETGKYAINSISTQKAKEWLTQSPQTPTFNVPDKTKVIALQLTSTEPTDSFFIRDLNHRQTNSLKVLLTDSQTCAKDLVDWRQALTNDKTFPVFCDGSRQNNFILYPGIFERKKGEIENFDLTNRPFLVDEIANFRGRYANPNLRFGFWEKRPEKNIVGDWFQEPWKPATKRFFLLDTLGFNPENKKILLNFAAKNQNNVFIVSHDDIPYSLSGEESGEIIWISCLSGREIQARLQDAQLRKWFQQVRRIRVFNVGNSVFDLGNNLFIAESNLCGIGAWQRVLDFETMLTLAELLAQSPTDQELDTQIRLLVNNYKTYNTQQSNPTTKGMRLARKLEETLFSWEEIRPFDPSNANWEIHEQWKNP